MRNVERFLYVNTIAAENLNKIVANKLQGRSQAPDFGGAEGKC